MINDTVLQNRLGHVFKDVALLQQALTHRSHSVLHNERLEFLGDSVLNCVVASLLFQKYKTINEGDLSRLRANLVKQQSLYEIALRLELAQFLRLGEGELKSGGFRRPSILADTLEALIGAIFLDGGFNAARDVVCGLYVPILETVDPATLGKDAKTLLQEYLQSKKIALPVYTVAATHGVAHNQEFEVECAIPKLDIKVFGAGRSRRAGEQAAAKMALEAAMTMLVKSPGAKRKSKPRTTQLKLTGIATAQKEHKALVRADVESAPPLSSASVKEEFSSLPESVVKSREKEKVLSAKSPHQSESDSPDKLKPTSPATGNADVSAPTPTPPKTA